MIKRDSSALKPIIAETSSITRSESESESSKGDLGMGMQENDMQQLLPGKYYLYEYECMTPYHISEQRIGTAAFVWTW